MPPTANHQPSTALTLTLVRHGETEWIERGLIHGRLDSPLSARGRSNAAATASRLRGESFDALYSSSSGRAMETAGILAAAIGLQPVAVEGFRELDFGWFEGRALSLLDRQVKNPVLRVRNALARQIMSMTGENYVSFSSRIKSALDTIVTKHAAGRILVVAHWGVLSTLTSLLIDNDPRNTKGYGPWGACSISELHGADGAWRILRLNDVAHLGAP